MEQEQVVLVVSELEWMSLCQNSIAHRILYDAGATVAVEVPADTLDEVLEHTSWGAVLQLTDVNTGEIVEWTHHKVMREIRAHCPKYTRLHDKGVDSSLRKYTRWRVLRTR